MVYVSEEPLTAFVVSASLVEFFDVYEDSPTNNLYTKRTQYLSIDNSRPLDGGFSLQLGAIRHTNASGQSVIYQMSLADYFVDPDAWESHMRQNTDARIYPKDTTYTSAFTFIVDTAGCMNPIFETLSFSLAT